jgi:hypothetical protein
MVQAYFQDPAGNQEWFDCEYDRSDCYAARVARGVARNSRYLFLNPYEFELWRNIYWGDSIYKAQCSGPSCGYYGPGYAGPWLNT